MAGAAKQGGATYQTRGIAEHECLCTCSGCARLGCGAGRNVSFFDLFTSTQNQREKPCAGNPSAL